MRSRKRPAFKDRKEGLKILLINPFGIGDVLFSTPLISILKENLPDASLYYICNKRTYNCLENHPGLKGVFVFEKGDYKKLWKENKLLCVKEFILFLKKIKDNNFDACIDMSMGHQYSFFLKLLGVPERIGFNYKGRGRFLTGRLKFDGFNDKPIGEYYKDLLRLMDLDVSGKPTDIRPSVEDKRYIDKFFEREGIERGDMTIGIVPGGGISFGEEKLSFRRWPIDRFARLADSLARDAGAKIIIIWGPGEEGLVRRLKALMKRSSIAAPKTTIREMAALMARSSCVVCNDGGPLHVAVAAGAKTVSIFGPSDEKVYGPYPGSGRHLTASRDMECRPCYKRFRLPDCGRADCLEGLEEREVFLLVTKCIDAKETERMGR